MLLTWRSIVRSLRRSAVAMALFVLPAAIRRSTSSSRAVNGRDVDAAARRVGLPLAVERLADPAVRTVYGAPLVLVRPDGHVAWRGADFPDVARLIDVVRGA